MQHGSTYGGSPLASKVAIASLKVMCKEGSSILVVEFCCHKHLQCTLYTHTHTLTRAHTLTHTITCTYTHTQALEEEGMYENATNMGEVFKEEMSNVPRHVTNVRGRGLFWAVVIEPKGGMFFFNM